MLKKLNTSVQPTSSSNESESKDSKLSMQNFSDESQSKDSDSLMQNFKGKYKSVSIDTPLPVFCNDTLEKKENNVDYGVLELLKGTWFSYNESPKNRKSSGIHTTIMPSPGTNQNKIPGKFSFECEEYLEKLCFNLVPDPVRNRGGATEQFCGAIKYEQSIKSVNFDKNLSEGDIQVIINILENEEEREKELSKYLDTNEVITNIYNLINKNCEVNDYLIKPVKKFIHDFIFNFKGIHEENGMFLWMSDIMNHAASENSIKDDRGVHNWNNDDSIEKLINNLYPTPPDSDELLSFKSIIQKNPYLDITLYNVGSLDKPKYVTKENINDKSYVSIVPAKELKPGDGIDGGHFIPDYSISRSGVIPHGSTITLLGNITRDGENHIVQEGKPNFIKLSPLAKKIIEILDRKNINTYSQAIDFVTKSIDESVKITESKVFALSALLGKAKTPSYRDLIYEIKAILEQEKINSQWDYEHLSIDKTMGGGKNASNNNKENIPADLKRPFDLDNPPSKFTKVEDLNSSNDDGENIVYTQKMFTDPLYPYSIRPDFRLRDSIKDQNIKQFIHFKLSSKNPVGQQGGILNIPFVNKFVPTVEMNMNMWIEEVEEKGKKILQLQYEQIVFFEFGFGDTGGTTRWPHIQVNTLRKIEDLPVDQQEIVKKQFYSHMQENKQETNGCPFGHK